MIEFRFGKFEPEPQPSCEEITKFLRALDRMEEFIAQQSHVRGCGPFREDEIPIPECVKVRKWLFGLSVGHLIGR